MEKTTSPKPRPSRLDIARSLLADIRERNGQLYCNCPGSDLHTNPTVPYGCCLFLDCVPTIYCHHKSCLDVVAEWNQSLRSKVGRVEWPFRSTLKASFKDIPVHSSIPKCKPDRTGFQLGTTDQLARLASSRGFSVEGVKLAAERGLLVFGKCCGFDSWAVTDQSGLLLEARRLDAQPYPATEWLNERKSHAIRHSQKRWPIGIIEAAEYPKIVLCEGMPDFIEAHCRCVSEGKLDVAVVAMLSASPAITSEALAYFNGKIVRILPHAEGAGVRAAYKWFTAIMAAGAKHVDCFDFLPYGVNDLLELSSVVPPIKGVLP